MVRGYWNIYKVTRSKFDRRVLLLEKINDNCKWGDKGKSVYMAGDYEIALEYCERMSFDVKGW